MVIYVFWSAPHSHEYRSERAFLVVKKAQRTSLWRRKFRPELAHQGRAGSSSVTCLPNSTTTFYGFFHHFCYLLSWPALQYVYLHRYRSTCRYSQRKTLHRTVRCYVSYRNVQNRRDHNPLRQFCFFHDSFTVSDIWSIPECTACKNLFQALQWKHFRSR